MCVKVLIFCACRKWMRMRTWSRLSSIFGYAYAFAYADCMHMDSRPNLFMDDCFWQSHYSTTWLKRCQFNTFLKTAFLLYHDKGLRNTPRYEPDTHTSLIFIYIRSHDTHTHKKKSKWYLHSLQSEQSSMELRTIECRHRKLLQDCGCVRCSDSTLGTRHHDKLRKFYCAVANFILLIPGKIWHKDDSSHMKGNVTITEIFNDIR